MTTLRRFQPGEVIITEDQLGDTAYIILQGRVDVTKGLGDQKTYLGYLLKDDLFGEMSIIDDKPRSATITAAEVTVVKEIHRDEFLNTLQTDEDSAIKILKALFDRLRDMNEQALQGQGSPAAESAAIKGAPQEKTRVTLVGLTPQAQRVLPENPYPIRRFPFRIGRSDNNPLSSNDLAIPDGMPFQISRHHVMLIEKNDRIGVLDRRSTLGIEVDGQRFGGSQNKYGPVYFDDNGGELALGNRETPYRFKIMIETNE